jgi:hypothetical protein
MGPPSAVGAADPRWRALPLVGSCSYPVSSRKFLVFSLVLFFIERESEMNVSVIFVGKKSREK